MTEESPSTHQKLAKWSWLLNSEVFWTLSFGAVGGVALWTWEWLKADLSPGLNSVPPKYLLPFAFLGACSAAVSVFVVSGSNVRDKPRLVSLSVAAGFGFVLIIGNMFGEDAKLLKSVTEAAAIKVTEDLDLGSEGKEYRDKVVDSISDDADRPESPSEPAEIAEVLADILRTGERVLEGLGQPKNVDSMTRLTDGESVRLNPPFNGAKYVEGILYLGQMSDIEIDVENARQVQDLMAVLFSIKSGTLEENVAFDDDSVLLNPKLEIESLPAGTYLLRVLPFGDEAISAVDVRLTIHTVVEEQREGIAEAHDAEEQEKE